MQHVLFFLQEVTVEVLVEGLKRCSGAKGIIVNGYPRSMVQVGEYNKVVSMPIDRHAGLNETVLLSTQNTGLN